jgi:hypothetical protein
MIQSSSVLGVFIPPLPSGFEFSFPILIDIPFIEGAPSEDYFLSMNMYLVRGPHTENSWVPAFVKASLDPVLLKNVVVVKEKWILSLQQPLSLTTTVSCDPSFPFLDITPLDGGIKPFSSIISSNGSEVVTHDQRQEETSLVSSITTPCMFRRSPFLVNLSLFNNTASHLLITDASYVPVEGGAKLIGNILNQVSNFGSDLNKDVISTALSQCLRVPVDSLPKSGKAVFSLHSGNEIDIQLSSPPLSSSSLSGLVSLGGIQVSFITGEDSTPRNVFLNLGNVYISDDIIDCNISIPDVISSGKPVPISIRLENLTAHFQCLEVSSSQPSLEEAQRAGVERFELADRFNRYTVELLPFSVKKLSFSLLARNSGLCLLPLILIRSSGVQTPLSVSLPRAILVND